MTKSCSQCHQSLPRSKYSRNQWKKKGDGARCKDCVSIPFNSGIEKVDPSFIVDQINELALLDHRGWAGGNLYDNDVDEGQDWYDNTEEDSSDEEVSAEKMAEDDRCWDGNWMIDGLNGMFLALTSEDYLENEVMDFLELKDGGSPLQMEDEFLDLPTNGNLASEVGRLYIEQLKPRNLHLASGVVRRIAEGVCPPKIRIGKLDPQEKEDLLKKKKLGNQSFSNKEFEKAIKHYEEALFIMDKLFVAPIDQIKEVINCLSNQAECHLRLNQNQEAGEKATYALLFDENHEKSRIRRAKAELAIGSRSHVCQAKADLENVIEMQQSETSVNEAKILLQQASTRLEEEKRIFEGKNPDGDWNYFMRVMKVRFW